MKKDIHPDHHPVVFRDGATGKQFLTHSTATSTVDVEWSDGNRYPLIVVDVTADSHLFWTGDRKLKVPGRLVAAARRGLL